MAAMTAIDRTSAGHRRHAGSGIVRRSVVLAAGTLAIGISGWFTVPVVLIATLASLCALQLMLSLRARAFAVATAAAVIVSALLPASAFAEPEKKFAVGVVVTRDAATGAANAGTKLGPLFRIRSTPGLHPAFGLNWVMSDLEMNMDAGDGAVGRLRLRPLMAGLSYTWIAGHVSVSPRLIAGYSFNRFTGAGSVSARDSFVSNAEFQIWRDLSSRVGVLGSIGYLFARPEVSGRTVNADAIRAQLGIAYAVF
jgi:hypothetical protein